jgi:hypothetical protein
MIREKAGGRRSLHSENVVINTAYEQGDTIKKGKTNGT